MSKFHFPQHFREYSRFRLYLEFVVRSPVKLPQLRRAAQQTRGSWSLTFCRYWPCYQGYSVLNDDEKIGQAVFIYRDSFVFRDIPTLPVYSEAHLRKYETDSFGRISLTRTKWTFSLSLWSWWCTAGAVSLGRLSAHSMERHFVTSLSGWSSNRRYRKRIQIDRQQKCFYSK